MTTQRSCACAALSHTNFWGVYLFSFVFIFYVNKQHLRSPVMQRNPSLLFKINTSRILTTDRYYNTISPANLYASSGWVSAQTLVYIRIFFACYFLGMLIAFSSLYWRPVSIKYLTNLSYLCIVFYFFFISFLSLFVDREVVTKLSDGVVTKEEVARLPLRWYHHVAGIAQELLMIVVLVVTIIYWIVLFPGKPELTWDNFVVHATNTVGVYIDVIFGQQLVVFVHWPKIVFLVVLYESYALIWKAAGDSL
jgi:hypothetical protein